MTKLSFTTILLAFAANVADADITRPDRPRLVAIGLPFMFITGHDATIPVPGLHLGYQLAPRLGAHIGGGYVPMPYGAFAALAHGGVRYQFFDRKLTPYAFATAGAHVSDPDEGDGGTFPFVAVGGGLDLAARNGVAGWIEIGPGIASYENLDARSFGTAVWFSAGLGYRF